MLRANLIQPPLDIGTINMRLNSLDELIDNEDLAYAAQQCLSRLPKDMDRLVSCFAAGFPIAEGIPDAADS